MKRILFLTNYASPYRVRFFDELGKNAQVTVLYSDRRGTITHRDDKWFEEGRAAFEASSSVEPSARAEGPCVSVSFAG